MTKVRVDIDQAFFDALLGEDELGMVIRAHIHIEAQVNMLLERLVPAPKKLPHLRYEQKVLLLCALGLPEYCFPPLKTIGDIRNQFGHKLDTKLTDALVRKLTSAFDEKHRNVIRTAYENSRKMLKDTKSIFATLNPRSEFIITAVTLNSLLIFEGGKLPKVDTVQSGKNDA